MLMIKARIRLIFLSNIPNGQGFWFSVDSQYMAVQRIDIWFTSACYGIILRDIPRPSLLLLRTHYCCQMDCACLEFGFRPHTLCATVHPIYISLYIVCRQVNQFLIVYDSSGNVPSELYNMFSPDSFYVFIQSRLTTLLSSLIAHRRAGLQTL